MNEEQFEGTGQFLDYMEHRTGNLISILKLILKGMTMVDVRGAGVAKTLALGDIAIALVLMGEQIAARFTFANAIGTLQELDLADFELAEALRYIAGLQVEAGDFAAAIETANIIEEKWVQAEVLRNIAKMQVQVGNFAGAHETVQNIDDRQTQIEALAFIATAQAQMGEREAAQANFATALDTSKGIEHQWKQAAALASIAVAQAQAGERDAALATFAIALETTKGIKDWMDRVQVLQDIAIAQVQARDFAAALETAQGIEKWRRVEVLAAIAAAQVRTGEQEAGRTTFAAAFETVQNISEERARTTALESIAKAQVRADFGEQAVHTSEAILARRNKHLPEIADALVKSGDKENFKRLLIPCANYLAAAYRMCGLLARLYPEQASAVAEVVKQYANV